MCVVSPDWESKATCLTCGEEVSFIGLFKRTCIVVPATVCCPCSVLVEAQAIGRDGRRAVVAQRRWTAGTAVHILHVHATVAAGQVVFSHPAEQKHTEKHTHTTLWTLIYSFMYASVQGTQCCEGPWEIYLSPLVKHMHTHTHTQAHSQRGVT